MKAELADLNAFLAVARARGFRDAARMVGSSASTLSEAVRRLESQLGVRLLHRTTRSVTPTEVGTRLIERLTPALGEVEAALEVVDLFRERPAGSLRLNVPVSAARLVLPTILPGFLAVYPEIQVEIIAEDSFVDMVASGCDAGIRYDERLEQDMIAVPIGPRVQRFATAASPAYLDARGRPIHPRELLDHACLRGRFTSGALTSPWEFERKGEIVRVEPHGPLIASVTARRICWSMWRSEEAGSSRCSKTGCGQRSIAELWNRYCQTGGRHSQDRSSTIRAAAWCLRPCAHSSTSFAAKTQPLVNAQPNEQVSALGEWLCASEWPNLGPNGTHHLVGLCR